MKVVSIVGARPNFIKLEPVSKELERQKIDHVIIHTGQHYDYQMSKIFFEELQIPEPHYNLGVGSDTPARQLGNIIKECDILTKEEPDVVLVYGDTNSTLGGGIAAVKNSIPVGHVEAGLRCYDRMMQEELNRVLTDHLSEILFCPTKNAVRNLEKEGLGDRAFYTGDVMVETLNNYIKCLNFKILKELGLTERGYILLTLHRAENVDNVNKLKEIIVTLKELSKEETIVFPVHPRTLKNLSLFGLFSDLKNENIKVANPLSYSNFLALEKNAKLIMTDSGGVQKEAYILGIPCITLRERTEWIETVECGWNFL
ncbi:MAG: UDP-N-acetylglucosamine 2-epimerase (non-hydrolyzing), partial [Candidatus Methanomethylicaceae archaeon]